MAVVLDTNLYISAFKFRGRPLGLVLMGVERQIDIAISQSIIDETLRVLRDKFKSTEAELDSAEKVMRSCGRMVELGPQPRVVPDDPNDDHIVACAVAAGADAIITGDKDLLRMKEYAGIKMMTVGDFLRRGIQK